MQNVWIAMLATGTNRRAAWAAKTVEILKEETQ